MPLCVIENSIYSIRFVIQSHSIIFLDDWCIPYLDGQGSVLFE
uniref:Uncharacterized protein n=1 Tax=Arundo donax TaxID=35708 RepID=A0A0A8Y8L7_ARUDO